MKRILLMNRSTIRLVIVLVPLLAITGCSRTQPAKFYMIESGIVSDGQGERQQNDGKACVVAIGPVTVSDYLHRHEIAVRTVPYAIDFQTYALWAEPVESRVRQLVIRGVRSLLSGCNVMDYVASGYQAADYQAVLTILRFDGAPDGSARLEARVGIVIPETRILAVDRVISLERSVDAPGIHGLVAAQSALLDELIAEIASDLEGLKGTP